MYDVYEILLHVLCLDRGAESVAIAAAAAATAAATTAT